MPGAGVAIWRASSLLNVPWWVAIDPPQDRSHAMRGGRGESLESFERYGRSRRYYFDIFDMERRRWYSLQNKTAPEGAVKEAG